VYYSGAAEMQPHAAAENWGKIKNTARGENEYG